MLRCVAGSQSVESNMRNVAAMFVCCLLRQHIFFQQQWLGGGANDSYYGVAGGVRLRWWELVATCVGGDDD